MFTTYRVSSDIPRYFGGHVFDILSMILYWDRLVSFQKDSRPNPSHSNTTLWHPNAIHFVEVNLYYFKYL